MSAKALSRLALLAAAALALGWAESAFLVAPGLPWARLGLANTVLLYALYLMDGKSAWILLLLKVFLSGLLYAGLFASLFSLAGGVVGLAAMWLAKRLGGQGLSILGVSVVGAVGHNLGQTAAALVLIGRGALIYLPLLLVAGVVTGLATGLAAKYVIRVLEGRGP